MGADTIVVQSEPIDAVEVFESWLNSRTAEITTYFDRNVRRLLEEHWDAKGGPNFSIAMKPLIYAEKEILRQCFVDAGFTVTSLVSAQYSTVITGSVYR